MNEYDSNRILDLVKTVGYSLTKDIKESDCFILNTCHIREKATDKVYHEIGRVKKEFVGKIKPIILVAGCVAQAEGSEMLKREKYIDGVVGPQSYHEIPEIIKKIKLQKKVNHTEFETVEKFDKLNLIKNTNSKISSFLTIQEGCDKFCHFCVVPYTRGPEHSRSFNEIMLEAKQLVDNGAKEITLIGQNVNAYQYEQFKLSDLIKALENIDKLLRIRFTTSHPKDMTKDLIKTFGESKKLMPVLHLPVQSGSSNILKLMNRKHTIEEYYKIIEELVKIKPNIKFTSDFIIGYPGETDSDFLQTIDLMKKIEFINSYSFIFSNRPGTPAANLPIVDKEVSKERLKIFQGTSNLIKKEYRKKLINAEVKVLFENRMKEKNKYFGRDEFLNSVIVECSDNIDGKIKNVKILNFNHNTLFGEIIKESKDVAA